jgi:hypothetical protein
MKSFITCTQVKKDEMGKKYSTNGENGAYRLSVRKREGKIPRRRWVDVKMDLRERMGCVD